MKEQIKGILKKMPGIRRFYDRYAALQKEKDALAAQLRTVCNENINFRMCAKKAAGEPIRVVFVCHRPAVWESLHSVYDAMKQDPGFSVTLVAVPNKKQLPKLGLAHEVYESEGAEEFWKAEGCINGYDYETGKWLDLESLKPDYVFFQTPYNICRPPQYHSSVVSRYARICYVSYFGSYHTDEIYDECTPLDYLRDLYFFFTQNPDDDAYIKQRMELVSPHFCQVVNTGYPRYDRVEQFREQTCRLWNQTDTFKIVWTPRWTTNEGNCHFFTYKDKIVDYCKQDAGLELAFRPHPQAFKEWNATGELPEAEANIYRRNFENSNLHLDESPNYYPVLYSSDCLVTDKSSILLDYFCTGKPIIYCTDDLQSETLFPELLAGMYCVSTWEQVQDVLDALRRGEDPLKQQRESTLRSFIQPAEPAGAKIVNVIRNEP